MRTFYVESTLPEDIENLLDDVISKAKTISDRSTKTKYLLIGSGFDIETSRIPLDENEFSIKAVAYAYHWQFGIGDLCIMGRSLESMTDFMRTLLWRMRELKPNVKLLTLDANLGYEWQFCKHYWAKLRITDLFAKEIHDPIFIEVGGVIVFREVLGLFGHSLAQIAKNYLGIKKLVGDLDYSVIRVTSTEMTEKEIGYCIRDVEILVQLAENHIFKKYFGKNPRMPFTATGIVRDEIKRQLGRNLKAERQKIESWMPEEKEYELFRTKLFKGGISGGNILLLNKTLQNVRGADITSDYPYQMLSKKYPMGGCIRVDSNEFMQDELPYIARIKFHRFRSRTAHSLMSAHKLLNIEECKASEELILDNNRVQYAEFAEFMVNDEEYKALKKAYKWEHEIIKEVWKFPEGYAMLPRHIRDVVVKKYMVKQSLKEEYSDTQEYKDAKAFVNSIFGMMCTALYMEEFEFDDEECAISGDLSSKTYEECCKFLFLSPYWGFWITSYARAMLIDVITRFPDVIVNYDTDSVYFLDDGSPESVELIRYLKSQNKIIMRANDLRFIGEPLMKTIGTWTFTSKFKRFKCLGSKRYMYEKEDGTLETVVAGCRKGTIQKQNDYNNRVNSTHVDVFDFFTNHMHIDKEHADKLASKYVDVPIRVDYNGEMLDIPSCLVLEPIDFTMGLEKRHAALMIAAQRLIQNTKGRMVYDAWRNLRKLSTSITTQTLGLTTIGSLSLKSTKSSECHQSTTSQK